MTPAQARHAEMVEAATRALLHMAETEEGRLVFAEQLRRHGWTCTPPVVQCGTVRKTRAAVARRRGGAG